MGTAITLILLPVVLIGGFLLYLMPALIANNRKHKQVDAIFMLNLIFGWTFIGWGVALVWAFTDNVKEEAAEDDAPAAA